MKDPKKVKAMKKARERTLEIYGDDFYSEAAKRGKGIKRVTSGFGSQKVGPDGLTGAERAREAGRKGWEVRRRNIEEKKRLEKMKYHRPTIDDFKK